MEVYKSPLQIVWLLYLLLVQFRIFRFLQRTSRDENNALVVQRHQYRVPISRY